ncbi:MAG: Crp/Fnr family transcriptional regulator [Muribaculaceae bacterium]|nr:Crp/Fnr family transcriptional regulator [Muribaculaceae bacterium]MDE6346204.1 Crp/Fnr family transcriptional regulator [Muribaculaceae bacterium]
MLEIVGNTKFHFLKFLGGETIVSEGEQCTHIKFIISGKVRMSIANSDRRFTVSQTLKAPDVIAPEYIFGRSTVYPCTVVTLEPTGVLQISKADYMKILNSDSIFLINYLNLLSMNAQKAVDGILSIATGSLEERIAFWIVALTQRAGTDITMTCRQRDLYSLFGVQRSSFISTLDNMKSRGLIDYSQTEIKVHDRRELIDILHSTVE